jgi:5-(carboxyamino)imidazole ribonucleotide synthase
VTTVGVLGGGQLGRMLAVAGVPLGVRCLVVEPVPHAPAAAVAEVITAPYDDQRALAELARRCDVVTVELEGVPVDALGWLAERVAVHPSPEAVAVAQDRRREKQAFGALGISVAPWSEGRPDTYPCLVKAARGGFDGRGQELVHDAQGWVAAADRLAPCITEQLVAFDRELSIVAARGVDGAFASYRLVENRHRDGILRTTIAPAPGVTRSLQRAADALIERLLGSLHYVGVATVELFQVGDRLVANEMAPRVHNSGHWTIDGATTSQFEQHLRAILGWPLGDPSARGAAAMVNIIGTEPDAAAVLAIGGAHLHRYGKLARPGRKLGHVTVVAASPEALAPALAAVQALVDHS